MKAAISKQLLAGLLATAVLSVIALLKTETVVPASIDDALVANRHAHPARTGGESGMPWLRKLPLQQAVEMSQGLAPSPPVSPPQVVLALVPVEIPRPVAPNPSFTYLGRMMREDKVYVFLGHGEDVEVVAMGETVDSSWRVEGVDDASVDLRYLPLNEVRQLAMSDK